METNKIAINGTYIQKQSTGLGVFSENIISNLSNLSQEFDLIVYSYSSYFKKNHFYCNKSIDDSLSPSLGFRGHINRLIWYQTFFNWQLKKENISLVYSPVAEGILYPKVPQIITVHDLIPLKYPKLQPKWKLYYQFILPKILKRSQTIISVSQHTKKDLLENYNLTNQKIQVIYPGVDFSHFYPIRNSPKSSDSNYLLYVGDMRSYKNLNKCLEAFSRLLLKEYKFKIAGKKDSHFYPQIQQKIRELAIQDRVSFLDYVSLKNLRELYSQAKALVFCSLYEGFGLPILEAMACGCPIIASSVTSIPEVGGNAIYYVDPYDTESIAKGMYLVLTDKNLRASLIEKGIKRAKLFTWEKTVKKTVKLFEECLKV